MTCSSQVWKITDGGTMYSLLRSDQQRLLFSSVRQRDGFMGSPCHVTKKDSWRERVPQTPTKEITPFSYELRPLTKVSPGKQNLATRLKKEYNLGAGFDVTFKPDNDILSFVSRVKNNDWLDCWKIFWRKANVLIYKKKTRDPIKVIMDQNLSKHPSLCELFWYQSPDDGYWNRNVQHRLYIIKNSPIWIMFFCYLHTVRFWSIFTFILSFRKNKYLIQSYTTSNMDNFKTIFIHEDLLVCIFLKNGRIYLVSLRNPIFSTTFPRVRHVLITWIMKTMCTFIYFRCICSCYLSKHPSLCELFWYPSPDDGYWNRNV